MAWSGMAWPDHAMPPKAEGDRFSLVLATPNASFAWRR